MGGSAPSSNYSIHGINQSGGYGIHYPVGSNSSISGQIGLHHPSAASLSANGMPHMYLYTLGGREISIEDFPPFVVFVLLFCGLILISPPSINTLFPYRLKRHPTCFLIFLFVLNRISQQSRPNFRSGYPLSQNPGAPPLPYNP